MIAINEFVERQERAKKQGIIVLPTDAAEKQDKPKDDEAAVLLLQQQQQQQEESNETATPTARSNNQGQAGQAGHATPKNKNKRKKKKKNKINKNNNNGQTKTRSEPEPQSPLRGLLKKKDTTRQMDAPTIPVVDLYPQGTFPVGELLAYHHERGETLGRRRTSILMMEEEEEQVHHENFQNQPLYMHTRHAAAVHKQVRAYAQDYLLRPGVKLAEFCAALEDKNRQLVQECGLQRGIAFPTGVSLNHVAAHYTPNTGDETVLQYDDVLKVDFGTQVQGYIVDSAFTVAFNPVHDPLLEAVRMATDAGIRAAGVDARMCDIAEDIQEVMESYEVDYGHKVCPVKAIRGLSGHSIERYRIHGSKYVPSVKGTVPESMIMEEGEVYAIETFGSTGRGYVVEQGECSHYMKNFDAPHAPLRLQSSKKLLNHINKTFGTLAFCRRWLDRPDGGSTALHGQGGKQERYMGALKNLCSLGLVQACPPLCDVHGSYTAQYEHTILLGPTRKEVVTRGLDY